MCSVIYPDFVVVFSSSRTRAMSILNSFPALLVKVMMDAACLRTRTPALHVTVSQPISRVLAVVDQLRIKNIPPRFLMLRLVKLPTQLVCVSMAAPQTARCGPVATLGQKIACAAILLLGNLVVQGHTNIHSVHSKSAASQQYAACIARLLKVAVALAHLQEWS